MSGKIDAFLKISIAASVILAASSVGYYYVVYLPKRDAQLDADKNLDRARAEYARLAEQARVAAEKQSAEQKQAADRVAVQNRYQICVRTAENIYTTSWASQCKSIAAKSIKQHADCVAQGTLQRSSCDTIYSIADATPTCDLPRIMGKDLDDDLEKARSRCLQESQSGLR